MAFSYPGFHNFPSSSTGAVFSTMASLCDWTIKMEKALLVKPKGSTFTLAQVIQDFAAQGIEPKQVQFAGPKLMRVELKSQEDLFKAWELQEAGLFTWIEVSQSKSASWVAFLENIPGSWDEGEVWSFLSLLASPPRRVILHHFRGTNVRNGQAQAFYDEPSPMVVGSHIIASGFPPVIIKSKAAHTASVRCPKCLEYGHPAFKCPLGDKCRKCQKHGHQASTCPSKVKPVAPPRRQHCHYCGSGDHLLKDCQVLLHVMADCSAPVKEAAQVPAPIQREEGSSSDQVTRRDTEPVAELVQHIIVEDEEVEEEEEPLLSLSGHVVPFKVAEDPSSPSNAPSSLNAPPSPSSSPPSSPPFSPTQRRGHRRRRLVAPAKISSKVKPGVPAARKKSPPPTQDA